MNERRRLVLGALAVGLAPTAGAQEAFPAKPVRMIVGFGAGGISDVMARILSVELGRLWGQAVVVENRPGASGVIGAELVARAPADGHVLLMASGTHTITPALRRQMPYDAVKDFSAISLLASAPNMLVVNADTPYRTLADYLAAAKAKPGEVAYATSGIGTTVHIAGERLAHLAGVRFNHIPYKSSAQSIEAVVAGQVASSWSAVNAALPHMRSGRARALAVASAQRSVFAPEVPTFVELGIKDMKSDTWLGVLGPAGMPAALAARLQGDLQRLMARPDVRERVLGLGAEPVTGVDLDRYAALMREEIEGYAAIIRIAGIKAE